LHEKVSVKDDISNGYEYNLPAFGFLSQAHSSKDARDSGLLSQLNTDRAAFSKESAALLKKSQYFNFDISTIFWQSLVSLLSMLDF